MYLFLTFTVLFFKDNILQLINLECEIVLNFMVCLYRFLLYNIQGVQEVSLPLIATISSFYHKYKWTDICMECTILLAVYIAFFISSINKFLRVQNYWHKTCTCLLMFEIKTWNLKWFCGYAIIFYATICNQIYIYKHQY